MNDALDITAEQRKTLLSILRKFIPGVEVWAYGSRVKWTARPNSDLDLVAFTSPAQRPRVSELKEALSESNLPFLVDLHVWDEVPEKFREIIRKEYAVVQEARSLVSSSGWEAKAPIEHDLSWPVVTLGEIATKIGSGATPKGGADTYLATRSRFALVRSQNVFDRHFDHAGLAFITDEQAVGLRGVVLQRDDILLNITGDGITFGRACIVPTDVLPACVNQHVSIIRLDPQRAVAGYVLAFLTHPDAKPYIESFNAGGSRRAVTKGHIESFQLPLPPLPEQRAIAHILGTLDDKIELNRRLNETLEAMARALFKSWFVDFDPVRAKAEGRDPGLPQPLADLFPDAFEDSELGEIPKGWGVRSIYDIADVIYGAPFASSLFNTNGIGKPLIRIRNLADESPGVWTPEVHTKGYMVKSGDIVVGMDGEFRAYLWGGADAWLNQRVCVFVPKNGCSAAFVRNSVIEPLAHIEATETATTVIHLGKGDIDRFVVVVPTPKVLLRFNQICQRWYDRMVVVKIESRTLATLRDTLLPKLISGEFRVKDANRIAEIA